VFFDAAEMTAAVGTAASEDILRGAAQDDPPMARARTPQSRAKGPVVTVAKKPAYVALSRDAAAARSAAVNHALAHDTYTNPVFDVFHPVGNSTVRQCVNRADATCGMVDIQDIVCLTGVDWEAFRAAPATVAFCEALTAADPRATLFTVDKRTTCIPGQAAKPTYRRMWAHPDLALFMAAQAEDPAVHDALVGPLAAWKVLSVCATTSNQPFLTTHFYHPFLPHVVHRKMSCARRRARRPGLTPRWWWLQRRTTRSRPTRKMQRRPPSSPRATSAARGPRRIRTGEK
jgi:hypothetical protein